MELLKITNLEYYSEYLLISILGSEQFLTQIYHSLTADLHNIVDTAYNKSQDSEISLQCISFLCMAIQHKIYGKCLLSANSKS